MLGALCPLDVLDIFVRSSYVNYYTYCISVYTRNGRTTAIRPKMLQRSGKASRSATVRIAQQTTPTSLSCLDQVVSKSAKQRNHISRRPQSLRSVTSEDGASIQPPALEAALTRDGRQMVRSSGTNTTSTTSTRTRGYCCGPLRSFNRPPAADFLPGDSYTFENSNPLYRPVSRVARSWKSSSASLVDEDAGVESAADNTERRGELKSFLLTDVGEGILEVEVLEWFVKPGERVRQFDKLCEVQSDKANVEITSRYDGVVRKVHWSVGDMVQTGSALVDIEEDGAASPESTSSPGRIDLADKSVAMADETSHGTSTPPEREDVEHGAASRDAHSRKKVLATPAVRRLCRDLSIDFQRVDISGTGPGGRVLKSDVLRHAEAVGISIERVRGESTTLTGLSGAVVEAVGSAVAAAAAAVRPVEEEKFVKGEKRQSREPVTVPIRAGVPKAMMEAMQKALQIPHMTFCDEITADKLSVVRVDLQEAAERRGLKLSFLPLVIKATSMALKGYPNLNASLSEDKSSLLQYPDHNIGIAMDTEKGLLVPCISAVQERSVLDIAEELNALQRLASAGKLGEAELTGTTFTLSNIGSIGGTYASPVILHPQVCIGALGKMQRLPRFDSQDPDKVIATRIFPVSWSADHRVVDGATLAQFSNAWKAFLENPALMLADAR